MELAATGWPVKPFELFQATAIRIGFLRAGDVAHATNCSETYPHGGWWIGPL
jgi:hypothetical protein